MDCDAGDIVCPQLYLAGMQPAAHGDPKRRPQLGNCGGAAYRPRRTVKGREKPVAQVLYGTAARASDLLPDDLVMLVEQPPPWPVADFGGPSRRIDDIREQDRGQDAVGLVLGCATRQKTPPFRL